MTIKKSNGGERTKKTFARESILTSAGGMFYYSTWANIARRPNSRPRNPNRAYKIRKKSKFRASQIRKVRIQLFIGTGSSPTQSINTKVHYTKRLRQYWLSIV
jgi:hypothetical protein